MRGLLRDILLLLSILIVSKAQFGIKRENAGSPLAESSTSKTTSQDEDKNSWSAEAGPLTKLTEQDALDIRAIIESAGEDPETIKLIAALKDENQEHILDLQKLPQEEIMNGLKDTLDEMKMLDVLFQDPNKALEAFEKEGLIPMEHLAQYRQNPSLLEDDTRKGLYFQFISLAVVGGYL